MKDIGEKLKNTREKTGISIEEAAEDLNYKASLLEDIENGKKVVYRKLEDDTQETYLGLDVEEIIDEFNDFVFESTSKIPLEDIEKASKLKEKHQDVKIASPYTATEEKDKVPKYMYAILILFILLIISIVLYFALKPKGNESFNISYNVGEVYEERI